VVDAAVGDRLDDHREDIDTDAEFLGDEAAVPIVAGFLAQFGDAGGGVADADLTGLEVGPDSDREAEQRDDEGRAGFHAAGEAFPIGVGTAAAVGDPHGVALGQVQVGEQDRQQEEVGDDDDGDAEAGGDGELVDGGDLDHHHRDEADDVADEGDHAGRDELDEGVAGGGLAVIAGEDLVAERADFWTPWLTPMAKTRNGTRIENGSTP